MQVRHASSLYGFESISIIVGGVVNQDQNLAEIIASNAASDVCRLALMIYVRLISTKYLVLPGALSLYRQCSSGSNEGSRIVSFMSQIHPYSELVTIRIIATVSQSGSLMTVFKMSKNIPVIRP